MKAIRWRVGANRVHAFHTRFAQLICYDDMISNKVDMCFKMLAGRQGEVGVF